ncbi:MAG: exonuclease SbcCD subunit D [Bacteroidales bacterium]|nr:exonuclease SbcCD subunit D [Bacteroidales bacterium]
MKFIHTADWHIGQKFYDHDRTQEHIKFFEWLKTTVKDNSPDALLISGDIFDVANPSSESQSLLYNFLAQVTYENPFLQIIITAGNHDSASRLEAPSDVMRLIRVHIVGNVKKDCNGQVDYDSLIVKIRDNSSKVIGYVLAVPFLRPSDYIGTLNNYSYEEGITSFYSNLEKKINEINKDSLPVIAMGHLHAGGAEISDSERVIRGGLEVVDKSIFANSFSYTALGHIHKAQKVGNCDNVRYSGSILPLSFSEINYSHKILLVHTGEKLDIKDISIPRFIDLIRIGTNDNPMPKEEVLSQIDKLPNKDDSLMQPPYLEINILFNSPDPIFQNDMIEALKNKNVLFCRAKSYYPDSENQDSGQIVHLDKVLEITPEQMLEKAYFSKWNTELPTDLKDLFSHVVEDVTLLD